MSLVVFYCCSIVVVAVADGRVDADISGGLVVVDFSSRGGGGGGIFHVAWNVLSDIIVLQYSYLSVIVLQVEQYERYFNSMHSF